MILSLSILYAQFLLLKEELRCSKSKICKEVQNIVTLVVWYSAKHMFSEYPEPLKCGLSLVMSISSKNVVGMFLSPVIVSFEEVTRKHWRKDLYTCVWPLRFCLTPLLVVNKSSELSLIAAINWTELTGDKLRETSLKKNNWTRSASVSVEGARVYEMVCWVLEMMRIVCQNSITISTECRNILFIPPEQLKYVL